MYPIRKTWADVRKGGYIRAKDGVDWKVEAAKPGFWGLISRTGEKKILPAPPPDAPVDILHLDPEEMISELKKTLGAEWMGDLPDGKDIWICPPFEGRRLEDMKSHLFFFHGISSISANDPGQPAGMNSTKALTECHNETHLDPGPRHTPHVHQPLEEQW